jgi:hypothetical protein
MNRKNALVHTVGKQMKKTPHNLWDFFIFLHKLTSFSEIDYKLKMDIIF